MSRRCARRWARRVLWAAGLAVAVAAQLALTCRPAHANGRFPQGSQIVFDAADPRHLVVTTTFGFIDSRDGGAHFEWKCESALGLGGETDMMLAIPASGETVLATFNGVSTLSDGCFFAAPVELAGRIVPDLTLSASEPQRLFAFDMAGLGEGRFDSHVFGSDDSGHSWRVTTTLAAELLPLTIDVAPSDSSRLYLSARQGVAFDFASVLLRSRDGGASFEVASIPETSGQRMAYIAAVHPRAADVVFLRVDDPLGTVLWKSVDGGLTFHRSFAGKAQLPGFAFSPDGASIVIGGPQDGIWLSVDEGAHWAAQSQVGVTCLGWNDRGLYACATAAVAGFSLGLSKDAGQRFEPLFSFHQLSGKTACNGDTPIGAKCPLEWPLIEPTLGSAGSAASRGTAGNGAARPSSASARSMGCAVSAPGRSGTGLTALAACWLVCRRGSRGRRLDQRSTFLT